MKYIGNVIFVLVLNIMPYTCAMEIEEHYDRWTARDLDNEIYHVIKQLNQANESTYNQSQSSNSIKALESKYVCLLTIREIRIEEERMYDKQYRLNNIDSKMLKKTKYKQRATKLQNEIEVIRIKLPAGRGNDYEWYKQQGFIEQGITDHDSP